MATQETIKQITQGGVTRDVEDTTARQGLASKVDKNGTDSLMTAAEHTKLGSLPTNPVQTISVNGGTPATPVNGNVNISVEGGGSVESVTVSGTKYTPDINGDVDLGDLRCQDGNSGVASADGVESVNNLNGGTTDTSSKVYVLGANQGKRLRDQMEYIYGRLQAVYNALGNIAFWDGKTAVGTMLPSLDWGNPKHTVALTLSLTNAVVKYNGTQVGSSIQVEEGSTVNLTVEPASGYAFATAPTVTKDGTSITPTDNGDGTYTVSVVMGQSNIALSISATATLVHNVTLPTGSHFTAALQDGNGNAISSPVASGSAIKIAFTPDTGYEITIQSVTMGGSAYSSYTFADNVMSIASVTGDIVVSASASKYPDALMLKTAIALNIAQCTPGAPDDKRRAVVCLAADTDSPISWWGTSNNYPNENDYSLLPIKPGASTLTIRISSSYIFGACLIKDSQILTAVAYENAGATKVFDLTQYPTATHFSINIKNTGNTTIADSVTMVDMGLEFEFS